ncbi:MAG: DUF4837 family protein, partial [Bacteroidota bacterium]
MNSFKKYGYLSAVLFAVGMLLSACSMDAPSLGVAPQAFGKTNQINIVADKDIWDGPVGDTLRNYFSSPFLLLPQPEPIFDLRHF